MEKPTELRRQMIESMQLHGLAPSTQATYVNCVRNMALYYRRSPDQLGEPEIRRFFLHLLRERKLSEGSFRTYRFAVRFFYQITLGREIPLLRDIHPPRRKKLPVILAPEEVASIIGCVRNLKARACLWTIYSCGLRRCEGVALAVDDIDSKRMVIRVRKGKGGKDRYVPLALRALILLREYWGTCKPKGLLFPSPSGRPMCPRQLGKIFQAALRHSGVRKEATLHTLRHSYATHLLESGVDLRTIQEILGHTSPRTTAIYTHVTDKNVARMREALDSLLAKL